MENSLYHLFNETLDRSTKVMGSENVKLLEKAIKPGGL